MRKEPMKRSLALLALMASLAPAADLAGRYSLRGVMEVGSELKLKPDGSFEYMLADGSADYFAKGAWKRDSDSVVLNSSVNQEPPFKLIKSSSTQTPGIRVWVKG